jgi:RNA polymerase sigma-70 factor (ECF subfamily)
MDPTVELVHRSIKGDTGAFDRLVREYGNTVLGLAYNYVGDFHTAEDIAQDTFVQAYKSIAKLRDASRFKVWLLRIARNKCIDHFRQNPRMLSMDQDPTLKRNVAMRAVPQDEGESTVPFSEEDLILVLGALRQDYREIFVMKHIDNLSYRDISELLGMTVTAVGEKLYRVRAMIRAKLEEKTSGSPPS